MISTWRSVLCTAAVGLWVLAGCAQKPAVTVPKGWEDNSPKPVMLRGDVKCKVQTTSLCQFERKLDGQWLGSTVASDGKVYFGSSSHSSDTAGKFFQYDPATKKVIELSSDLSSTCSENAKTQVPQGKIHSMIVEHNGWLYFATHIAAYWPYAVNHYTGSHVLAYRLGSAEAGGKPVFRDFGVVHENYTSYAGIAVDPVHNYVYVMLMRYWNGGGGYLYRFNADGSNKTQIAAFNSAGGGQCFYMFVDKRGDLWFAHYGNFGALNKVDGKTGRMTTYPDALPAKMKRLTPEVNNDITDFAYWGRAWLWGARVDGDRCVFSGHVDGGVYEFDASKVKGSDAKRAFRTLKWLGTHTCGLGMGGDTLYYIQSADPNWLGPEKAADHHLKSIKLLDPQAAVVDHGRLVDHDGRTPFRAESIAADAKGHVYLVGDWRVKPKEIGTSVSSLSYDADQKTDPNHVGRYFDMWRGQFFGAVTLPEAGQK